MWYFWWVALTVWQISRSVLESFRQEKPEEFYRIVARVAAGISDRLRMASEKYTGATGTATEMWCTPYGDAVWEDYISGRGVSMLYRKLGGKQLASLEIYKLARQGQKRARVCWQQFGGHLGRMLSCVVNLVDPDVIIVGGSIASAYSLFQTELKKQLYANINSVPRKHLKLKRAALGEHSGLIGACCLLLHNA